MMHNRQVELRIGISLAFGLVMALLTVSLVGYLYWDNSKLILETASKTMARATLQVDRDVQGLLAPVERVVQATAELARVDTGSLQTVQGLGYLQRQLVSLPQVFSFYLGFENSGDFYQVFAVPPTLKQLGPSKEDLPQGVRYAARLLNESSGHRADSFIFYKEWGDVVKVDRGPVRYDPRVRPWYKKAWEVPQVAISDAYVFASSKLIGLTLSSHVSTPSDIKIGVVGADITLDTLSSFLYKAQIGLSGRVFLLNADNYLVGHREPDMGVEVTEEKVRLRKATEVRDPLVAEAVQHWQKSGVDRFETTLGPNGDEYMVSFAKIGGSLGWTAGVLVQKEELIGPLADASIKILVAGSLAISLAIFLFMMLSQLLTRPLSKVTQETVKIRRFNLEGNLNLTSYISEVRQLVDAVETMKRSLRSFSVYVPKEIVRAIVEDEDETSIGSRRQPLTVMFSDIKGFSNISEELPPEQLVGSLSEYMEQMSQPIHRYKGTIDKFIGDAIMALWNAPSKDPDHVVNACRAMLGCHRAGLALAETFAKNGRTPFYTRFGLHTGEAVVGNVGSTERMQYSAFGNMVNMASRLESMNKQYDTELMVSEHVARVAQPHFYLRRLDKVVPVGNTHPMYVYELMGEKDPKSPLAATEEQKLKLSLWHAVMDHYEARDWHAVLEKLALYKQSFPHDKGAEQIEKRCHLFIVTPPPADWDGAEWLKNK
ncbi:adenylate/guanylate cyclase [Magnetococcus marinus MC-1]|uniref:Adenylate/guanylate cyclase n=1 Tax=Magnetococcus marinus (strain ATCC BAA-1437 / JCM 17883 / MC-1) TaxID=156889 RepID=A0LAQ0_MAGMM|nr:adenylate/guanylate cyclase domain-containing protein [Magnetococcus marinus]ABK45043.1 adenylate/guanylate cyclase [Magnetococcus marinus MC-1]